MTLKEFYLDFEYTEVYEVSKQYSNIDLSDFLHLGVDKVYFSGDYPAILFKEVKQFNNASLKQIAHIQHLAWNYRKVMFLFVLSLTEIRIYNCTKKPFNYEKRDIDLVSELENIELISSEWNDISTLQTIKEIFSRIAVDCGLLWTTENDLRDKVDIQQRIDRYLVKALLDAAKKLKKLELKDDIIHSLLMRSIFIMYLEDKGAAKETKIYSKLLDGAESYLDILENKNATYTLFTEVESHFNGNVFPILKGEEKAVNIKHLKIIKSCLTDGNLSDSLVLFSWRIFRFDIIQIELLSEIYENFLEEFKSKKKEEAGQYYTPPPLVELILNDRLKTNDEVNWNIKVLDPACGSGIFLVESFKRLVKRWKNANPQKEIEFKDLREIIKKNIFGIEYDRLAIRVTAFSLYLAMIEQLNPSTLWYNKTYKFPYLINDPEDATIENQGKNLYRADTIGDIKTDTFGKVDLVVGNPPFGAKIELPSIKKFCIEYGYGQDMVIPFLRKAIEFIEDGSIALIFNTKVLTNTEGPFQKFRKWLFNDTYVEKVYNLSIFRKAPKTFGGQLFSSAVGPVSIIFYQKQSINKPSPTIEYWAPKTFVKNSLVEGVLIDSTDIKFLPREECQKSDTKIWKIAMWGSFEDFKLIEKLNTNFTRLKDIIAKLNIKQGVGFQLLTKSTDKELPDDELSNLKYLDADSIKPYYTPKSYLKKINTSIKTKKATTFYLNYYNKKFISELPIINIFRRLGDKDAYVNPHFVIKKGLEDGFTCASFLDFSCSFRDGVYGFYGEKGNTNNLKIIASYLNSIISNYYLFLSNSSYGIERDQIMKNEYLDIPFPNLSKSDTDKIISLFAKLIDDKKNSDIFHKKISINEIDEIFIKALNLTAYERFLIEDAIKFSIDLFIKGKDSVSLKATNIEELRIYATITQEIVNEYLNAANNISIKIFDIDKKAPLNLIIIKLSKTSKNIIEGKIGDIVNHLDFLNKISIKKEAKSIYIKKIIKYYDVDTIYILKPNQKRFWSRSMAINDAKELINEIIKM